MNKGGSRESLLKATVRSDFWSLSLKMTDLGVPDLGLGVLCLSIRFSDVQKKRRSFRQERPIYRRKPMRDTQRWQSHCRLTQSYLTSLFFENKSRASAQKHVKGASS